MKKAFTVNLIPEIPQIIETSTANLKISRNLFIESHTILDAYQREISVDPNKIAGVVDGFSTNQDGKITSDFRNNVRLLPLPAQWSICAFMSGLNLTENTRVTTQRMANIWKYNETLCYFAFWKIAGRDIDVLIKNLSVQTIGSSDSDCYVYLSNLQQFKIPQPYPKWHDLLRVLQINQVVDVLKVDHSELVRTILPAVRAV